MGVFMKERIAYVDAAKGLSILMIALGHITKIGNPVDCWMSSFKVSIFYIISGFLMCYTGSIRKKTFKEFMLKILKSLGIPYLSFSIIGILFKTLCVCLKHKPFEMVYETFEGYIYDSIFLKGINSMWFIPTLFIGEIIFYWIKRSPKVVKFLYAVAGLFSIKLAHIITAAFSSGGIFELSPGNIYDNIIRFTNAVCKGFSAAWFLGAGYIIYLYYKKIKDMRIKLAVGTVMSIINIILSQINIGVDFNQMAEGKYPYMFYICGIIGSVGAIMLLDVISSYVRLTFLDYWGKNSMIMMCTHTLLGVRTIAYEGWKKVAFIPETGNFEYIFECLIVLAILLMIEYSIIEIINTWFPFLIGKNRIYHEPIIQKKGVQ